MQINGFDFKPIQVEGRYNKQHIRKSVYLSSKKDEKGNRVYNRIAFSVDIADKLPFGEGDVVEVLECGNVFAIRKCEAGKFATKFTVRRWGSTYTINSLYLAQYLLKKTEQIEFKAWVAGDMVMFSTED